MNKQMIDITTLIEDLVKLRDLNQKNSPNHG